nr:precursor of CEP3-like [Tanacetum cinerariifolium]
EVFQMSDARKLGENFKEGKMVNAENSSANPSQMPPSGVTIKEGDLDAFRPTTPGHSPGVGHSIQD